MERNGVHELTASYALDALDDDESRAYEQHLAGCESCREELTSLQEAASALAYAAPPATPPDSLRARILEQARAERGIVVPLRRRWAPRALGAAAAVAACAAIGLGVWAATLRSSLDDTRSALSKERAAAQVLADPAARRSPVSGASGTLAVAPDGTAVLALQRIPPAPSGKTYEAWVLQGRTSRPAGLFRRAGPVLLQRDVPRGSVVAVTVERAGGVDSPTMHPRITARA
jgi:anti-sigma-K factor RskA